MGFTADGIAKPYRAVVGAGRARPLLVAAVTIGLLVAGCGTTSLTRSSTSRTVAALEFVKCMRGHGVPNLPDPGSSISGPYNSIGGIEIPTTIDTQSPAFQAAQKACRGQLSAASSSPGKPGVTASVKTALIAHAQCMRTHGVPDYPDPTFPASGGIAITDAGTNPQSPAYQYAQSECGNR
jgi:hypothetical protein